MATHWGNMPINPLVGNSQDNRSVVSTLVDRLSGTTMSVNALDSWIPVHFYKGLEFNLITGDTTIQNPITTNFSSIGPIPTLTLVGTGFSSAAVVGTDTSGEITLEGSGVAIPIAGPTVTIDFGKEYPAIPIPQFEFAFSDPTEGAAFYTATCIFNLTALTTTSVELTVVGDGAFSMVGDITIQYKMIGTVPII